MPVALGMPALGVPTPLDLEAAGDLELGKGVPPELRDEQLRAMREGRVASVHSWELVTAVDGPGTRMTLFLSGCPLRCLYCQNPDTMEMRRGSVRSIDEVMTRVRRYQGIMKATGGGLTISGGEPLFQSKFVENVFAECHELGIHTALDTSGFLGRRASDRLLDATSLVLLDVKSGLPETYKRTTTRELQPTIDFGDRLAARGTPVWVRFVLVPGLTDAAENVEAVARIVEHWPNVERLEVLPFHQMGRDKWHELGLQYQLEDTKPPSHELCDRVLGQFTAHGLPARVA